jgi:Cu(I)/Ag(I) efflux system membrane fusion protein
MDPGVLSVWPAICPICNMDLVPRNKMDAVLLPEGVVARMQLSPYRIQLAGIKTAEATTQPLKYELISSGILRPINAESVGFEANISLADSSLFRVEQAAEITAGDMPERCSAKVNLIDGLFPPRISIVLDDPNSLPVGSIVNASIKIPVHETEEVLAIPASAVVDHGQERLVYVESMPGTFDAVSIEVGRRCGSYYPVLKGLKPGQRFALAGAFLIDAETRLNPSLAAGYFGANPSANEVKSPAQPPTASAPVVSPQTKSSSPKKLKSSLSPADQILADKQRICPVTELPLNTMGGPVPVIVAGRKVFICCAGCEKRLIENPEKYLTRISSE